MPPIILPNLGLSGDTPHGEDNWDVQDKANIRRLDTLVHLSVKNLGLNAPPGSPTNGDRHIIGTAPTGEWVGHAKEVAVRNGSAWDFYTPKSGWKAFVEDQEVDYRYHASTASWEIAFLMDQSRYYVRSWDWETMPPGGTRHASAVSTLGGGQVVLDTSTGANRVFEVAEDVTADPTEDSLNGERWWTSPNTEPNRVHDVRAIIRRGTAINMTGDAFLGIGFGSPATATPWTTGIKTGHIHLRYNLTLERWELAIGDGQAAEVVEACSQQPSFSFSPQAREARILFETPLWEPGPDTHVAGTGRIRCYVDNVLIHTYTGAKMAVIGNPATQPTAQLGRSVFVTSGSNASGRVTARISWNMGVTRFSRDFG